MFKWLRRSYWFATYRSGQVTGEYNLGHRVVYMRGDPLEVSKHLVRCIEDSLGTKVALTSLKRIT